MSPRLPQIGWRLLDQSLVLLGWRQRHVYLQSQADGLFTQAKALSRASQTYYAIGQFQAAKSIALLRAKVYERAKVKRARAAFLIYQQRNKHFGIDVLDLHGLLVEESLVTLKQRLELIRQHRVSWGGMNCWKGRLTMPRHWFKAFVPISPKTNSPFSPYLGSLVVITGAGHHSVDRIPRIKPSVIQFLRDHDIPHQIDTPNTGCVLVLL